MMHHQTAECYKCNYSVCEWWGILQVGRNCHKDTITTLFPTPARLQQNTGQRAHYMYTINTI